MRVLYIFNDCLIGGLTRHVLCLMETLKGSVETAVAVNTEVVPQLIPMFEEKGLKVYRLKGTSGHDWRIINRFRKVLHEFRPDVIHAHGLPLFVLLYLYLFSRNIPIVHSLHTSPMRPTLIKRLILKILEKRVAYWLPVSNSTWKEFRKLCPNSLGEVFYNPIVVEAMHTGIREDSMIVKNAQNVIGMVGRSAEVKDWPAFIAVCNNVRKVDATVGFWGVGVSLDEARAKFGDKADIIEWKGLQSNGREWIRKMDLFIMTSKHEQLPTVVLECFAERTPICGFLPDGGTKDILAFSNGAVRSAFIDGRDSAELARIVEALLSNVKRRQNLIEDGWNILVNHFDAKKSCKGQLIEVYRRISRQHN